VLIFLRRIRWVDGGKNFHCAATTLTFKNVHQEHSAVAMTAATLLFKRTLLEMSMSVLLKMSSLYDLQVPFTFEDAAEIDDFIFSPTPIAHA
jgi:hypothetical protein